jgi:hypothetical protein
LIAARLRAELRRLASQGAAWGFATVFVFAAAWGARWSPTIVNVSGSRHALMSVSLGGAAEIASLHIATGLGVALAALLAAAGPGRDFVDGNAEVFRARGTPAGRFLSRALAVTLPTVVAGLALTASLVIGGLLLGARDGFAVVVRWGTWNVEHLIAGVLVAVGQVTWVVALSQRLRTQAAQLTLPLALCVAVFLISRLSPYPVTPDSWIGPLLGLRAERAMLDFWWSVGGEVGGAWGNATLLALVAGIGVVFGARADRPVHAERDNVAQAAGR